MLRCPKFKPHLRVEVLQGSGIAVLFEGQQLVLQGKLYEMVSPLLDGRPVEKITEALREHATPARVFFTLNKLQQSGLLCEKDESLSPSEAAFWTMQGLEPRQVVERQGDFPISLRPIGVDPSALRQLLEMSGLQFDNDLGFRIVVTDHYLRRELDSINRESLETGRPWLLVRPVGGQIWLGPLFRPGKTACYECLALRIRSNFPVEGFLDQSRNGNDLTIPHPICTPATLAIACGMVAAAVSTLVAHGGEHPLLEGKLITVNPVDFTSQSHTVLQNPHCPVCGPGRNGTSSDRLPGIVLQSRKKTYTDDGGHRAMSPQETLDQYGHHVSPICGAVTMLERSISGGGGVFHVYESGNNIARGSDCLHTLKSDLRSASSGKGINDLQAKASALCEALERHSSVFRGHEPRRRARLRDLGDDAIHPNDCMLFSERQYQTRHEWNRRHPSIFAYVPAPFDPEMEMDWSPVWSMTRRTARYLPTAYVYFNYPHEPGLDCFMTCSNGNSAGNSLEEAILQGFFELVERDAVGLWWYNRVQRPALDLDSFQEPYLHRLKGFLRTKNREIWALDLTSDLRIPVFAALSRRVDQPQEQILFGYGAHFDPRIAMLRAVTEMNQMVAHLLDAQPDQLPAHLSEVDTVEWIKTATVSNQPYLLPGAGPAISANAFPRVWTDDLKEDLHLCQAAVEKLGLEMLVHDLTRSEIGMPVVKVLVPGLRHFWPRFAPGRLYDTPVKLGWLQEPVAEEMMNPIPMFL